MRCFLTGLLFCGLGSCVTGFAGPNDLAAQPFGRTSNGERVFVYTLAQGKVRARVTNFGATLVSVDLPDREGLSRNVLRGFDDVSAYEQTRPVMPGGLVSVLPGAEGSSEDPLPTPGQQIWKVLDQGCMGSLAFLRLGLDYNAQENGKPVELRAEVTFTLNETGELAIEYEGSTTGKVHPRLSHVLQWNLAGWEQGAGEEHELQVHAEHRLAWDRNGLKTETWDSVAGGTLDYRMGARLDPDPVDRGKIGTTPVIFALDPSCEGEGLSALCHAARLVSPASGCGLDLWTDQPQLALSSLAIEEPDTGPAWAIELRPVAPEDSLSGKAKKQRAAKVNIHRCAWRFFTSP